MGISRILQIVAPKVQWVPGYNIFKSIYVSKMSPLHTYLATGSRSLEGYHEIQPRDTDIAPFELWLEGHSIYTRWKMEGTYELPIMQELDRRTDGKTIFYEVGGGFGYFSIALASKVRRVYTFDKEGHNLKRVERSARKNGFDNVETVRGTVGEDVNLEKYERPDVILMDIEGWEYKTLKSVPNLLDTDLVWIVEIHDPRSDDRYPDHNDPDKIVTMFEENGFTISEIYRRNSSNYHILAEPVR